jgi:chemotaxis protein CheD
MRALNVGIGDLEVSRNQEEVIKTYALGSCVAVIAYDKVNKVAGLMHVALPEASINPQKAAEKPGYFADSGMPAFMAALKKAAAAQSFLVIKLAGGASIMDDNGRFDIGKRNILAIRKLLWKIGLGTIAEDVGGSISRTVTVSVATGEVTLSSAGKQWSL